MLVLRRIYIVVEGIVPAAGIEVVGKAIEVVVYISVIAEVYGLEAVFKVSEVSKVYKM